ncbi:MAG: class I SAM-dependent methyltransferase [Nitrososphaerales archaeon]
MLKQILSTILSPEETAQVYSAFDQIGQIVIIKIPDSLMPKKLVIANAILENIKTAKSVFAQVSAVQGDYRVRELEHLAGENQTITEYKEHGCRFKVDVAKTYFSPRLSTERQRIASMVHDDEVIVNMFAGVGTYSIVIAKANRTCRVYSIDSNSAAAESCEFNAKLNKVQDRVISICGDAATEIRNHLAGKADRVIMPLPERASEFVSEAVLALKPEGGMVHYFAHIKAENKKASKDAGMKDVEVSFSAYKYEIACARVVREVGPRIYQIVSDIHVTR